MSALWVTLHIQGTYSYSHIRPVIINQRGTAGEGRAFGYIENWTGGPGFSCSQIPPHRALRQFQWRHNRRFHNQHGY